MGGAGEGEVLVRPVMAFVSSVAQAQTASLIYFLSLS